MDNYDDVLGDGGKSILTEKHHVTWCVAHCIKILNELVDKGLMGMSDGGEKPFEITEDGLKNLDYYWKKVVKREPTDKDIEIGMDILKQEGYI